MLARIGIVLVALLTAGSSLLRDVAVADDGQADLLLVLAADVSYSIDAKKFALQRQGYAAAISDPRVIKAMTGGTHRRIALCFIEWADDYEKSVIDVDAAIDEVEPVFAYCSSGRSNSRRHASPIGL